MDNKDPRGKQFFNSEVIKELAPYLNIGVQITVTIGFCAGLGWFVDRSFDSKPIWLMICSFLGIVLAFYNFFRSIRLIEKRKKKMSGK